MWLLRRLFGTNGRPFATLSTTTAASKKKVDGRHLPTVSYGQFLSQLSVPFEATVFAHLDRIVISQLCIMHT